MTEKDKAFMRRAIELSHQTSLVDQAGGVFGTVIADQNGQITPKVPTGSSPKTIRPGTAR